MAKQAQRVRRALFKQHLRLSTLRLSSASLTLTHATRSPLNVWL